MNIIKHLHETRNELDCTTTFVDLFSEGIQLVLFRGTDAATDVDDVLCYHICRLRGCQT